MDTGEDVRVGRRLGFGAAVSTLGRCLSDKDPVGGFGRIPESMVEHLVPVFSISTVSLVTHSHYVLFELRAQSPFL